VISDKRPKILIVDDDENVLIALERVLEGEGYCTATAWSGREALDLLRHRDFDLLLVDEQLADVDVNDLFGRLEKTRPPVYRLLLLQEPQGAIDSLGPGTHGAVCKWEHGEITAKVRSYLNA
jgi:DNA-binding response OmpR family regulator